MKKHCFSHAGEQMGIQNAIKSKKGPMVKKKINGLKSLFSQNTPSSMFDRILNNPLESVLLENQLNIFKTFPLIVVKTWYYSDQKMSPANINSHCHVIDILSK